MTYARPHIVLRQGGIIGLDGRKDRIDIDSEIVAVNWAPSFEGPLSIPFNLVPSAAISRPSTVPVNTIFPLMVSPAAGVVVSDTP